MLYAFDLLYLDGHDLTRMPRSDRGGFTRASTTALRKQVDRTIDTSRPARGINKNGVVWVKLKLAAEIAYRGWTHDDKLRHALFKGLREKADESSVYRRG